jgi:hypothetical protein
VDNLLDGVGRRCGKRSDRVPRDRAPRSSARCFCREAVAVPGRHVKIDTNRDSRTNWTPTCLYHVEDDVRGRFGSNRWLLRADVESGDAVGARGLSRPGDVLVGMTDDWGTVASLRILPRRAGWGLREPGVSTVVRRLTNSEINCLGWLSGRTATRDSEGSCLDSCWCWCGGDSLCRGWSSSPSGRLTWLRSGAGYDG